MRNTQGDAQLQLKCTTKNIYWWTNDPFLELPKHAEKLKFASFLSRSTKYVANRWEIMSLLRPCRHARARRRGGGGERRWVHGAETVSRGCITHARGHREVTFRLWSRFIFYFARKCHQMKKRKPFGDNKVLRNHIEGLRGSIAGLLTDWSESPSQKSVTLLNLSFGVAASKYLIPEYFQAVMKKTTKQKGGRGWWGGRAGLIRRQWARAA